nr:3-oxoacyl-[acyl-carrier-protein] synthase II [Ipomoea trifida]
MAPSSLSSPLHTWLVAARQSDNLCNSRARKRIVTHCGNRVKIPGKTRVVAEQSAKEAPKLKRRVVVTGVGVVSPIGHDADLFYNNLLEGVSGISEIEGFDCSKFPTRIAGEIKKFSADGWVSPKLVNRADKSMLYMLTAGKKALEDGGVTDDVIAELDKTKCGIVIGSALGGLKVCTDAVEASLVSYRKVNPFSIPFGSHSMGAAILAMDLDWMGPNYAINANGATSNFCILNAANHILRGNTKRKAKIYAEILGGSLTCDAYNVTEPHPDGAGTVLCIEKALAQSGVGREDVNYINAHASSTPDGDLREYEALIHCFIQNPELKMNSTKSMIGNLLGAAGAVEAIATVKVIDYEALSRFSVFYKKIYVVLKVALGFPLRLYRQGGSIQIPILKTLTKALKKERLTIKVALSNSFGFGGLNSCILFAPYKDDD